MIFKKFEFPVLKVPVGNKVYIWLKKKYQPFASLKNNPRVGQKSMGTLGTLRTML